MGCSSKSSYLFQINVTRDCNLRCTHCYIHSEVKKNSMFMCEGQIVDIARKIADYIKNHNRLNKEAEIHIIGGEPTMLGLAFYQSVMPQIRKELEGIDYTILLISNLLSHDILEISQMFDKVSTSYEPETRFPKEKLFKWWERSVALLLDNGVELGATVAMTKQTIAYGSKPLLDYLLSIGIKNLHYGFFIPEGDGLVNIKETMPKFIETSEYLKEMTDLYIPLRGTGVYINPIESMFTSLTEQKPMDDIVCPIISGSIDINWDGNCNSCLEAGGAINPNYSGNIFEKDIIEIVENKTFMKEVLAAKRPKKICLNCEYHPICQGACSVLFKYHDDSMEDCPGFKTWIDYLKETLTK